jgi:periplasmic protein CpxP/Spy
MKVKALSLVAGAIALTLTATPFAVKAQTSFSSNRLVAQAQNPQTPKVGKKGFMQQLNLTPQQQSQIDAIKRETRAQMEAVLTPAQKAEIEALKAQRQSGQRPAAGQRQAGQRGQGGFARINLSDAQKTQMRQIMETSQQRIQAVLTPEQQAKLQELRENARSRWQQRRNNQGPQSRNLMQLRGR